VRASSGEVPGEKGNGHDLDTGTSLLDYPGGVPHRSGHSVGSCLTCGARKATPSDVKLEPLRLASRNSSNIRPLRPVSSTMYPAILGECKPGTDYSTGTTESRPARLVATCFPRAWVGFCRPTSTSLNLDPQGALGLSELLQVLSCGEESATVTFESLAHSCHEPRMRFALTQIAADERRHQVLLSGISAALPPPRMDPEFAARMRRFFMRLAHRDVLVHFVRIAALDSVAWLLNIRGQDVDRTPVALSFVIARDDGSAELFIAPEKVTAELRAHLGNAVAIRPRDEFAGARRWGCGGS